MTVITLCWMVGVPGSPDSSFELRDWLGRTWTNERVVFAVSPDQERMLRAGATLIGPGGEPVPYQEVGVSPVSITFQADVAAFGTSAYRLVPGARSTDTDLRVTESADTIRIESSRIGIDIHRQLRAGRGPIEAIRLGSGRWVGGSRLGVKREGARYTARVTERGPVLVEVTCRLEIAEGPFWEWRFRVEADEPVVLVDERGAGTIAAEMRLDLETLAPTHILHRLGKGLPDDSNAVGEAATWKIAEDGEPLFVLVPWLPWWERVREGTWLGLYDEARPDLLMVGAREPGLWVDPARTSGVPELVLDRAPTLGLAFPAPDGERRWMLAALDREASLAVLAEPDRHRAPLPQQLLIKHGDFPLDRVKDQVLAWRPGRVRRPQLFLARAELRRHRATFRADPQELDRLRRAPIAPQALEPFVARYLGTEDAELGQHLARTAVRWMQDAVDLYLHQDAQVTLGFAPHRQSRVLAALNLVDAILDTSHVRPAERERILAQIAFLGYLFERADYWSPERGFSANPNMTSSVAAYRAMVAGSIPDHPRSREWLDGALRELSDNQLANWSDANGGWLEAPHYALVSYDHMLGVFLMAHRAGVDDSLFDPRMKRIIEWLAKISTPPDARVLGRRFLPPVGNTYSREPSGEFGTVAYLWRERDPEFSAQMQWMQREQGDEVMPGIGGFFPTLAGYRTLLRDPGLPARPPSWESELFPETGVLLRHGFPGPRETRVYLIAGSNHQHYEHDSGSITLWGRGRIVADDFGYTGIASGEDHSMVVSERARAAAVLRVNAFVPGTLLDYVRGAKPGWTREIAFVKDDADSGPSYFVVADTVDDASEATWRLWLATARVDLREGGALAHGTEDVDTEVVFVAPAQARLSTEAKTRATWGLDSLGRYGRGTRTQTGLVATASGRTRFVAVIYPRLRTEPAPSIAPLASGEGVKLETPSGTDWVFLAGEPIEYDEGDVSFRGTVGLVRKRGGEWSLGLGAAGAVRAGGRTLESDRPAESAPRGSTSGSR